MEKQGSQANPTFPKKTKFYISIFTLSKYEINQTTSTVHAPKVTVQIGVTF
jgi:hypothetical protein